MPDNTCQSDKSRFIWSIRIILIIILLLGIKFGSSYVVDKWPQNKISINKRVENEKAKFNPSSLSWLLATSSAEWQPRDSAVSFIFDKKIWTMGGLNGNEDVDSGHTVSYWNAPHFNDIWNSDDGIIWNLINQNAAWPARRSMSVVLFKDKLWMLGGWSIEGGYTNDIWQSDDGISWKKVVSYAPWQAREGQTLEIFDDKIWLIGGVNYDIREVKNDVWYSENGITWNQVASSIPWGPRWDHDTEIFENKIFLSGGMNLSGEVFKDVWSSYDGIHWELVNSAPPWSSRQGHSLITYKNKLWTIGRLNDNQEKGENDIWYSTNGKDWEKTDTDPPWTGREDHSVLSFKDKLYVFGGMDSNWVWRNDVWLSN